MTGGGPPCSAGSRCYVGGTGQDSAGCILGKTTARTAGTGPSAVAVVAAVAASTFVVVFSAAAAVPIFVVVSNVPAAVPAFAVVLAVAVAPTFVVLSVVVAVVDTFAVGISAGCAVAGVEGWSMAEVAGCSCWVLTCSEVDVPSCCTRSWLEGPEDPLELVMMMSEVAGLRSVLTELAEVSAPQFGLGP